NRAGASEGGLKRAFVRTEPACYATSERYQRHRWFNSICQKEADQKPGKTGRGRSLQTARSRSELRISRSTVTIRIRTRIRASTLIGWISKAAARWFWTR